MERSVLAQDSPRSNSQHKGHIFALEGQRAGNKRQGQEREDEGEGRKEQRRKGRGIFSGGGRAKECLWIERRQV